MTAAPAASSAPAAEQPAPAQGASPGGIDDALVKRIAERVYQLLLQDMQIERERLRLASKRALASRFRKGGR